MLTQFWPYGWMDVDTICAIIVEEESVAIRFTDTHTLLDLKPANGDTPVALADRIAALVNRRDDPDQSSQRRALS